MRERRALTSARVRLLSLGGRGLPEMTGRMKRRWWLPCKAFGASYARAALGSKSNAYRLPTKSLGWL